MIKKLTFIIILSLEIVYCSTQNSFKLKIGNQEYIITANNINDTFEVKTKYNTYDMMPLIYASYSGNLSLAKFSIENGANVNAKDKYDDTALGVASEKENLEMVKYLVENGTDVNIKNDVGETALNFIEPHIGHDVIRYGFSGEKTIRKETIDEIVNILKESGAK